MSGNGKRRPPRPRLEIVGGPASGPEAAAVAAAIERFLHDTAPAPAPAARAPLGWSRVAIFEGARVQSAVTTWGDAEPWGR